MSSDDIAVRVNSLSKCYQLYDAPRDRLKQFVAPRLQRLVGQGPKQYFREFWALKDVSFEVNKGEAVGVVGRNGAGKSTLLQMICGTLSPTSGSVEVAGTVAALLELGSGFNPEFTGRENAYLNASVLGLKSEEIDAKFDEIAAFADIGDFLDQPVKTYSSGMLMRLAFAVNVGVDPEILIVDEALGVGDAPFQSKCFKRLRRLIADGTSVLFVSHDLGTIRSICGRALWLKDGRAEMWGDAKSVAKAYEKFCWHAQGVQIAGPSVQLNDDVEQPTDGRTKHAANAVGDLETRCASQPHYHWPSTALAPLESSDRYGNQDVMIFGFEMRNEFGEPIHSCSYGAEVEFVYFLDAKVDIDSAISIGLIFRDKRGVDIFAAHNFDGDDRLTMAAGERLLASAKLNLPLTHQDYVIQIGVFGFKDGVKFIAGQFDYTRAIIWDVIEKAAVLTVGQAQSQPLSGPVHAPMSFSFRKVSVV